MKKIKKNKIFILTMCVALSCFQITNIYAASFSVGSSSGAVEPGGSFSVSINVDGAGLFGFSGSNASVSASSQFCDGSCSVSATAGSSGTATVTVSALDVTGYDESPVTGSQSVSVTINAPSGGGSSDGGGGSSNGGATTGNTTTTPPTTTNDNKSSDNALSSLVVSKGTLDPIFESGTTEYKIALGADVTAFTIEATPNDAKASVSGTGEQSVKPGDNKLEVIVTAENGSTKTYVINAYVDEKPTSFIKMNGKDYGVVPNVDNVPLPTGFEKTTLMVDGKEIPVWKNSITNVTLVYLLNEKSDKDFYIFENNQAVSIYKPIALLGYNLAIIDVPSDLQTRKGFVFAEVEIDGHKLPGWTFENESFLNYSLIYVMNEKGEKVYFQYEKTSNTLQPYSGAAAVTQAVYEQQSSTIFILWITSGVLGTTTVLFLIMWVLQKRKNKHNQFDYKEDTKESVKIEEEQKFAAETSNSVEETGINDRPQYHRQVSHEKNEPRKKEVDLGTQPFRFHDDFDDI